MTIPPVFVRVLRAAVGVTIAAGIPAVAGAQPSSAAADSAAMKEVLTVAQTLLRSINTLDTSLARPILLAGGAFVSVKKDGAPAAPRVQSHADFLANLKGAKGKYLERIWSPRITIEGPLAEVRAPYDFHVDGKFSHCGVDVFTLVKGPNGWVVSGTAYTVQQTGCAPSPLGVPE